MKLTRLHLYQIALAALIATALVFAALTLNSAAKLRALDRVNCLPRPVNTVTLYETMTLRGHPAETPPQVVAAGEGDYLFTFSYGTTEHVPPPSARLTLYEHRNRLAEPDTVREVWRCADVSPGTGDSAYAVYVPRAFLRSGDRSYAFTISDAEGQLAKFAFRLK